MKEILKEQEGIKRHRRSFFELMTEVVGWLQIVASPFLAGLVIGFLIYLYTPDTLGILLGIAVAFIGLIVGAVWATKVWKGKGRFTLCQE
jgi:uncharacterized membrane protein (DUF485 family)